MSRLRMEMHEWKEGEKNEWSLDKYVSGNSRMMESVHFRKFKMEKKSPNKALRLEWEVET